MSIFFNYNGKYYKGNEPVTGPDNRGLRYGDGLFETIRLRNGNLLFADDHLARLWNGLKILQFDLPRNFSPDSLEAEILALAKKNEQLSHARVRLNVFRGDGGLYDAKNHQPDYLIQTWTLADDNGLWNSNGLVLGIYEDVKKSCDILSNLKHNNYLPYVMAALKAKSEKWNDSIILNMHGRICDSSIANIFLVKDNIICTPALSEGCVAGIMRQQIIRFLKENNYSINEKLITIEEILNADELFLTNSIYNLRWVKQLGNKNYSNSLTQQLYADISHKLKWQ